MSQFSHSYRNLGNFLTRTFQNLAIYKWEKFKKPWISKILTCKCLNFLTFLTHSEIWENLSLKPPKSWQFISEKSEIIPKHFENLTYKSLNFLNILIWTPPCILIFWVNWGILCSQLCNSPKWLVDAFMIQIDAGKKDNRIYSLHMQSLSTAPAPAATPLFVGHLVHEVTYPLLL